MKKEGYTEFYAKPSKPDPNPPTGANTLAAAKKSPHKVLPNGTKAFGSDELGKELQKIFPGGDGGPDLVAVHPKGKLLVGDVTAQSSSISNPQLPGDIRRLPNDLEAEDFTRHHLDKTKRDAVRLSDNLSEKYSNYDIEFQDRYSEDPDHKTSKRFKVKRKTPASVASSRSTKGGIPDQRQRGTGQNPDEVQGADKKLTNKGASTGGKAAKKVAKKKTAKKGTKKKKKIASDSAKKKAGGKTGKKAADAAKKKTSKKAADAAEKKAAQESTAAVEKRASDKATKGAEKKAVEDAKARAVKDAEQKAVEAAKQRAIKEAEEKVAKEAEEAAAKKAAAEAEEKVASKALAKSETKALGKIPLKVRMKIKAGALFILQIGFDLFLGWLDNKRIQRLIAAAVEANKNQFETVMESDQVQEDIAKFRKGDNLEKGYQLYFYLTLFVTRHCSDGGCGSSGSVTDVYFKSVTYSRTNNDDSFPDPTGDDDKWGITFNGKYGAEATFYIPIFEKGDSIEPGTADAADDHPEQFIATFVDRKEKSLGSDSVEYFDAYQKYALFMPGSNANIVYNLRWGMDENLVDLTLVELGRKDPIILMYPPNNLSFLDVINKVRWGLTLKISFIADFYKEVMNMNEDQQIYYLELYDKYFRLLDDQYTKCDYSCHRLVRDRRLIHRITADDVRANKKSRFNFEQDMLKNTDKLKNFLDRQTR